LDQETLDYAHTHNLSTLSDSQRKRLELRCENVMNVSSPQVDVVYALNYSYSVFKSRSVLGEYFRSVYKCLNKEGVLILDAWGGPEAQMEMQESRKVKNFTYIWEQKKFNPITHEIMCHIHFKLKKGEMIKNAFTYDWRLWTLPELRELLLEAGFPTVDVLWENCDADGEGNGVFRRVQKGSADDSWIVYVVAHKTTPHGDSNSSTAVDSKEATTSLRDLKISKTNRQTQEMKDSLSDSDDDKRISTPNKVKSRSSKKLSRTNNAQSSTSSLPPRIPEDQVSRLRRSRRLSTATAVDFDS